MQATLPSPQTILNTFADTLRTTLEANSSRSEALRSYSNDHEDIKSFFVNRLRKTEDDATQWITQCHSIDTEICKLYESTSGQPNILNHCCAMQITDPEIMIAQQALRAILNHDLEIKSKLPRSINYEPRAYYNDKSGIVIHARGICGTNLKLWLTKSNDKYALTLCNLLSDCEVLLDHTRDNSSKKTFRVGQLLTTCIMPLGIQEVDNLLEEALPNIMEIRSRILDVQAAVTESNTHGSINVAKKIKLINGKIRTAQLVIDWLKPIANNQPSSTSESSEPQLPSRHRPTTEVAKQMLAAIKTMLNELVKEIESENVRDYLSNKKPNLANEYLKWIEDTKATLTQLISTNVTSTSDTDHITNEQTSLGLTDTDLTSIANAPTHRPQSIQINETTMNNSVEQESQLDENNRIQRLENEISHLKQQNQTLEIQSNGFAAEVSKLKESNRALQNESTSLRDQLRQIQDSATNRMSKISEYFRVKNIMAQRFTDTGRRLFSQCKYYESIIMAFGGISSIAMFALSYTILSTASTLTGIGTLCLAAGAVFMASNFYLALAGGADNRTAQAFQENGDFLKISEIQTNSPHIQHRSNSQWTNANNDSQLASPLPRRTR